MLTTTLGYDGADLVSVTDPLGRSRAISHDLVGRSTAVTDALGKVQRTAYDNLDRAQTITDPLGNTIQSGYDANSNLTSFTDSNNHVTQFAYDVRNRRISKTDALGATESYQYDTAGNLSQVTDRKGQVSGFAYDFLNRRTSAGFGATVAAPTAYVSTLGYTWDAGGRLTQVTDSVSGTVNRTYDGFNHLTSEITSQGQVSYSYYANGARQSMTIAGQPVVSYTYDAGNRLTHIAQGSASVGITYDTANRRSTLTLPSGVVVTYSYDNATELTGLTYQQGSNVVGNLTYTYDANGRRVGGGGSLAGVNLPVAVTGNMYNANNQVTAWGSTGLTFDGNGSVTSEGGWTYSWDERNRLTQIASSGTTMAIFQYDAFNRRVGKTIGGVTSNFLYDGWQIVQELSGAAPTANLLTGLRLDEIYRRTAGSAIADYVTDALGSTVAIADGTGAVQTSYTYEPYGNTSTSGAASDNLYQYTGRENDNTGLYYYRNRYLRTTMGRFVSEDPLGFAAGQNVYLYTLGNPLSYTDPLGLKVGDWWDVPANYSRAMEIAGEELAMHHGHNDLDDAMRHAEWSQRMTEELGSGYAWAFGTGHEIQDTLRGQPLQELRMDLHNNQVGRDSAGKNIDSCKLQTSPGSGPTLPYDAGKGSTYPY